ncbi:MAG: UDP-glucose 4-epimerase [Solirubrobacteraceae bacterium]|nr:UDP-glucose 4-epimerase [Solirubrobacteraceae bacterium]
MSRLLILGAGYIGAALAQRALDAGREVTLADNWYATDRAQLAGVEACGARVEAADIRDRAALDALLAERPDRVYLLAAQASRSISERDPDYTEETNVTGARRVAEAVAGAGGPPLVYGSSLHVYGPGLAGEVGPEHPYGEQSDLAHLSKIYAELCLSLYARRHRFGLALMRLGIVYGPGPVEHDSPDSQTVVDKFRRRSAAGESLQHDDGGAAPLGVAHIDDVARILLDDAPLEGGTTAANVAAETVTVADVAALARGESPQGGAAWTCATPFTYETRLADYLRP